MNYAKLIGNEIHFAPNPILVNGNWIGNPPGSVYESEGFKAVVYADEPGEAPDGYRWVEKWMETENIIQQYFVLEEEPITDEEALVRYVTELTGEENETLVGATETLIKIVKEER